jgi:hypothetical protein
VSARVVVIHADGPIINLGDPDGSPAHCFGPFESIDAAQEFSEGNPDGCYKAALVIVGPAADDVRRGAIEYEEQYGAPPRVD